MKKYAILLILTALFTSAFTQEYKIADCNGYKLWIEFDANFFYVSTNKKTRDSFQSKTSFWFDSTRLEMTAIDSIERGKQIIYVYELTGQFRRLITGDIREFSVSKRFTYRDKQLRCWALYGDLLNIKRLLIR